MYQHILLAVELVDKNHLVEDRAAQLQKQNNAELSVIHVIEPLPPVYAGVELGSLPEYSHTEQALTERTEQMIKPVAERLGITKSNTIVAYGNVSDEILSYAKSNDIDLIIAGSHGRHGLQLLLGSTANALLHRAKCDVLSVRIGNE